MLSPPDTVSANELIMFSGCQSPRTSSVGSSGQILLPGYLMKGLSNLNETYRKYSVATNDGKGKRLPILVTERWAQSWSLISQNLKKKSRDPEPIPFWGNLSCMYSFPSISTRHLKCLASPIPRYDWVKIYQRRVS